VAAREGADEPRAAGSGEGSRHQPGAEPGHRDAATGQPEEVTPTESATEFPKYTRQESSGPEGASRGARGGNARTASRETGRALVTPMSRGGLSGLGTALRLDALLQPPTVLAAPGDEPGSPGRPIGRPHPRKQDSFKLNRGIEIAAVNLHGTSATLHARRGASNEETELKSQTSTADAEAEVRARLLTQ